MNPRRLLVAALVSVTATLGVAAPAFAHIDPDPTEAQAGSEVSVGFTVEHGCEGSPTVQLDMRLPDGVTSPQPEPPAAWTGTVDATVDGNVVTFVGGPLPDEQELTFRVTMVLPPTPDTTIFFPFVQRCEVGEIRWIDIPTDDSSAELDEPAPAMQLFGPVATTVPAPTTPAPTSTAATATTAPATTASPTTPATTSALTTLAASNASTSTDPAPTNIAAADTADDGGSAGTVVFVGVLVALAVIAAIVIAQARRRRP